jgi:hypothetical protein
VTWWKAATTEPGHLFGRLASNRDSKGPLPARLPRVQAPRLHRHPAQISESVPEPGAPGPHRPRASLRRPVKPGDGDPEEMAGLSLPRSAE